MHTTITRGERVVTIGGDLPFVIIGERINPTGKKRLTEALAERRMDVVLEEAKRQIEAGAHILDVNVCIAGDRKEPDLMTMTVQTLLGATDLPLCIDSPNWRSVKAGLEVYHGHGRPLVNSVTGEQDRIDNVLPLVKEHDASTIGMLVDDDGIPDTPEGRLAIAEKIVNAAEAIGVSRERIVIDCVCLTLGADDQAARITLDTIRLVRARLGTNVVLGASNVSFGLPNRRLLNTTFLAMAMRAGMTCGIVDPTIPEVRRTILAADALLGKDAFSERYIEACRREEAAAAPAGAAR